MERNRKKNHSMKLFTKTGKRARGESGEKTVWSSVLVGVIIAVGITVLGLIGGSFLFYGGVLAGTESQYRWVSILIMILAVGAGSFWVLHSQKGTRKWWVLAMIALYFLVRLVLSGVLLSLL